MALHRLRRRRQQDGRTIGAQNDDEAYCAKAHCACYELADIVSPRSAMARSFLPWGINLDGGPAFGCTVVLDRGAPFAHDTWAIGRDTAGHLIGFGFNQADGAQLSRFEPGADPRLPLAQGTAGAGSDGLHQAAAAQFRQRHAQPQRGLMLAAALAFVRTLIAAAPIAAVLVSLVGSGLGTGLVVSAAKDFWFEHVSTPRIQQAQRAADAAEFELEAAKAKRAVEERVYQVSRTLAADDLVQQQQDAAQHEAQVADLLQEIADYEQALKDKGRAPHTLDQLDLDFLGGVRPRPPAEGRRR
jgi:hypothetical protein